jgi:hypothetical protein
MCLHFPRDLVFDVRRVRAFHFLIPIISGSIYNVQSAVVALILNRCRPNAADALLTCQATVTRLTAVCGKALSAQKLVVAKMVKTFLARFDAPVFIAVLTTARHRSLS